MQHYSDIFIQYDSFHDFMLISVFVTTGIICVLISLNITLLILLVGIRRDQFRGIARYSKMFYYKIGVLELEEDG